MAKVNINRTSNTVRVTGLPAAAPRIAYLQMDGWSGRWQQAVEIIGETPTRYRIRAIKDTLLAGRRRSLATGKTCLVPKHAVTEKREGIEEV